MTIDPCLMYYVRQNNNQHRHSFLSINMCVIFDIPGVEILFLSKLQIAISAKMNILLCSTVSFQFICEIFSSSCYYCITMG